MSANFVHLHCHTEYSLLDGLSKIKKLVATAKELDMPALAITDHGVMYGEIEFYKAAKKAEIKPILGMEGYIVNKDHKIREGKGENNHIILLAKNNQGYKNLMKLSTIAHLEGFYYKPRFDKETLRKYSGGLICTSACPKGEVAQQIVAGNFESAQKTIEWYVETFGEGNYFLEIQRHFPKDYYDKVRDNSKILAKLQDYQKIEDVWGEGIIKLSRQLGIPLVATNDVHYVSRDDAVAQDALVCISTGKTVSDTERLRYVDTPVFYLKTPDEMASIFADVPDALTNTVKIADMCEVEIELGKWFFPEFDLPEGKDAGTALEDEVKVHLQEMYPRQTPELMQRIKFELDTIISKGYAPYFLMMSDLVNWCTDRGIITNTRGSAAGSVVSYIIGITTVDPIRYLLPFERFLNPFRPSPPDIDLDIADDRREELIAHVTEKYGKDKVAQICTFGRMLARGAVRDIGRVLGHPYAFPDKISKLIPMGSQGFPMTIERALKESVELKVMYDSDTAAHDLIDLARNIEGNARHVSVHAAGTVVSPTDMTDFTPLQLEPSGEKIITQYEFHTCEEVGLVKFDILGIRNLSILGAARDLIFKERGVKIDLRKIPLDDKRVFSMLARGETMGVFQMGGSGMTKWIKELKPTRVEDLMIMIAIFRPGPMANIPEYIARKNGKSPITYTHPKMAKFLDKSYGILVYQDDVLYTALEVAGYNWDSVDKFRKAIGKKIPEEMAKQHTIFVEGCQKTSGMTAEEAEKLWELFVPFQGYGFNKAHAASYGIVSYQTAYLKASYPVEYMTALLTAESGDTEKVVEAIEECKRMKIPVNPPDVNASDSQFGVEGTSIRFGFSGIKNVGDVAIKLILAEREAHGQFKSFTDFCLRVDSTKVNRKVLESLIKSGAMDQFGKRAAMLAALDKIRNLGTSVSKLKAMGQTALFAEDAQDLDHSDTFPDIEEFEKTQKLNMEKELLGFYLTEHPQADKLAALQGSTTHRISELYLENLTGKTVTVGGIVESVRNVVTKASNAQMCFARISDLGRSIEVVVFPKTFAATPGVWQVDQLILLTGKVEMRDNNKEGADEDELVPADITIIADTAAVFDGVGTVMPKVEPRRQYPSKTADIPKVEAPVVIAVPKGLPSNKLVELNGLLQGHPGKTEASLEFLNGGSAKIIPLPYGLAWTPKLAAEIETLLRG